MRNFVFGLLCISNLAFTQTPEVILQTGHSGKKQHISSLVFSHDGRYLASTSDKVVLWDVRSGMQYASTPPQPSVLSTPVFDASGEFFFTVSNAAKVQGWETHSGKEISTPLPHGVAVFQLGKDIAVLTTDDKFVVIAIADFVKKTHFDLADLESSLVSFNPGGTIAAYITSGSSPSIRLFDISTKQRLREFPLPTGIPPTCIQFITESLLAIMHYDSNSKGDFIKILDSHTGSVIREFKGAENRLMRQSFTKDGKILVHRNDEYYAFATDVNTGDVVSSFGYAFNSINAMCISPDGKTVAGLHVNNTQIHLFDAKSGLKVRELSPLIAPVRSIAFSADGRYMATGSETLGYYGDEKVKVWDLHEGKGLGVFSGTTSAITFSPDGKTLFTGAPNGYGANLRSFTFPELKERNVYKGETKGIAALKVTPDGSKLIVSNYYPDEIRVYDIPSTNLLQSFKFDGSASFTEMDLSPGGQWVVIGDSYPVILNLNDGSRIHLKGGEVSTNGDGANVGFSQSGNQIYFLRKKNLEIWDVANRRLLKTFTAPDVFYDACFTPDGRRIIAATASSILQWELETGSPLPLLKDKHGGAYVLTFTPDNKYLVSGTGEGKTTFWDPASGEEVLSFVSTTSRKGNDEGFVILTPERYYAYSGTKTEGIGFKLGHNIFPFEQFDLKYNRPDIVGRKLGYLPSMLAEAYEKNYYKRLRKLGYTQDVLSSGGQIPTIELVGEEPAAVSPSKSISLTFRVSDQTVPLKRFKVYINDVAVFGIDGLSIEGAKKQAVMEIPLELSDGLNRISCSVENASGAESLRQYYQVTYKATSENKPTLYVVAIGVSDYINDEFDLKFAAKDAEDLCKLFSGNKDKFKEVKTLSILNKDAVKEDIIFKSKAFLKQSKVDDQVILFIAGHGLLSSSLDYYFATANIDFNFPEGNGLSYDELEGILDNIPARKKLLFMDTCHSGELEKDETTETSEPILTAHGVSYRAVGSRGFKRNTKMMGLDNSYRLMDNMFTDLRRGTGTVVISSASGLEFALESDLWKNGVFTYAILEGITSTKADKDRDKRITAEELRDYIFRRVAKLTSGKQTPTSRKSNSDFEYIIY